MMREWCLIPKIMKNWETGTYIFDLKRRPIFQQKMYFFQNTWKSSFSLLELSNASSGSLFMLPSTTSIDQNWIRENMQSEKEICIKMTFSWVNGWNSYFFHQFWNSHYFCVSIGLNKCGYFKMMDDKSAPALNQEKLCSFGKKIFFSVENR